MHIQVETGFLPPAPPDMVRDMCWGAQEILAAYKEMAVDLGTPDEVSERDEEEDMGVSIHDTSPLQINKTQSAYLSNAPRILEEDGKLGWLLTPGYVALCVEPVDDGPIDDQRHLDERCDQVVFQLPQPSLPDTIIRNASEEAAIYHGFELIDRNLMKPHRLKPLRRLDGLLEGMRRGYRQMMEEDPEARARTYMSQVPTVSIADQFADFLQGF